MSTASSRPTRARGRGGPPKGREAPIWGVASEAEIGGDWLRSAAVGRDWLSAGWAGGRARAVPRPRPPCHVRAARAAGECGLGALRGL